MLFLDKSLSVCYTIFTISWRLSSPDKFGGNLCMKDAMTLSYINLYGILGALPALTELSSEARSILGNTVRTLSIVVKNGPVATLTFNSGRCVMRAEDGNGDIRLSFSTPEKFNGMIDGTVTPIPTKGLLYIPFLAGKFKRLTDLLTRYLQPSAEDMENPAFARISTTLLFGVIGRAVCQIANHDRVGMASASYIPDGVIRLSIADGPCAAITAKDHKLTYSRRAPEKCFSYMTFSDMETARALFDGRINSVAAIGTGGVRIGGMISQIDNVNRILDRVAMYIG